MVSQGKLLSRKGTSVNELWEALKQLFTSLGLVLDYLFLLILRWSPVWSLVLAWFAWWMWGVNWRKTWPVLKQGAWVVVVLVMVASALVWSQLAPSSVANFWWQLGAISLLTTLTLFVGWLQGVFGWTPAEINLEPPETAASEHGGAHDHH
jgi:hypothetical protein